MFAAAARLRCPDRRGRYLTIAGTGWGLFGVQLATDPRPGTVRAASVLSRIMPIHAWGWVWIGCGAAAVVTSFTRRPGARTAGFTLAEFPPLVWALGYAAAWIVGDYPQSWAGAATWAASALRLMVVAGWPDDPPAVTGGRGG